MGLVLVLLGSNSRNSRLGGFNSRQGRQKFPSSLLREFDCKMLIWLILFVAKTRFWARNRKNSRFYGNSGDLLLTPDAAIVIATLGSRSGGKQSRGRAHSIRWDCFVAQGAPRNDSAAVWPKLALAILQHGHQFAPLAGREAARRLLHLLAGEHAPDHGEALGRDRRGAQPVFEKGGIGHRRPARERL